jgi:predicted 3-demethylubiquinone-9 3-methyltransferase (glyoxalase superfamily)
MQKIVPHLWFDKEAKEATALYTSLFPNSTITSSTVITGTPSGDCDLISFSILGQDFMAISAGPYFTMNPSISLSVALTNEDEIKTVWDTLAEGGKVLMALDTYPWAAKYGWLQDKYGVSWQLSMNGQQDATPTLIPSLMFTQNAAGKAKEAIEYYTSIFPEGKVDMLAPYTKDDADQEGFIKYSRFSIAGQSFTAMDSSLPHAFTFNEGVSLIVNCDTQEDIDHYWDKLSAVPEAEQCGWCKDKFGVSWQITPTRINEMMASGDAEKTGRVTQAFLQMKKFDIAKLEEAYNQK